MKILVTGGAGFIGSHVAECLLERGDDVVIVDEMNDYYDVSIKEDNLQLLREKAKEMGMQLIADGVPGMTEEHILENFQFWGYNPPYTIPRFRRNEVWLKLSDEQVKHLTEKTFE